MKPSAIVMKTLPFMLIRLLAYLIFFIGICLYTALVILILGEPKSMFGVIMYCVFTGGGWGIYRLVREYITYMIKAAHVAVIADMAVKGGVPEGFSMYSYGVAKVKKFFVASNVLFGLDRLVSATVKQVQRVFIGISNLLSFIPGIKGIANVANMFVDIILSYVDECVMAYIFLNEGQNVFKSACDGVVLYAQNWKTILKTGAKILVFLIVFVVIFYFIFVGLFNGIFNADGGTAFIAYVITLLFVLVLKWAIVDSIIMIYMMCGYLKVSYGVQPSVDLYGKLEGISKKFKELLGKSKENPAPGAANP